MPIETLRLEKVRDLLVRESSQPGRPAHVSAASGLARCGKHMYVVADDELQLGMFEVTGRAPGKLVRILSGELPLPTAERKRFKPDFESLLLLPATRTLQHGALLALGSGSTPERHRGVIVPFDVDQTLDFTRSRVIDLTQLFDAARAEVGALNIEGAVATHDRFLLFQRGNKSDDVNAIVRFDVAQVCAHLDGARDRIRPNAVRRYELGGIGDVPFGFSDGAALDDGTIVFSAIAEDTDNSYADGPCAGAAIGIIDRDGELDRLWRVSGGGKIEGIHAEANASGVAILCVSDADDVAVPAALYRGALPAR